MKKYFKLLMFFGVFAFFIAIAPMTVSANSCTLKLNLMKQGSKGANVMCLQQKLGMTLTKYGTFGPSTKNYVIKFQKSKGLKADGVAGSNMIKALENETSAVSTIHTTVVPTSTVTPTPELCPNGNTVASNCTISPNGKITAVTPSQNGIYPYGCTSTDGWSTTTGQSCEGVTSSNGAIVTFSQNNININIGQSYTITLRGNNESIYYISNNSNTNAVSAVLASDNLRIYGSNNGNANISVCSNGSNSCSVLYVTVN